MMKSRNLGVILMPQEGLDLFLKIENLKGIVYNIKDTKSLQNIDNFNSKQKENFIK